MSLESLIRLSLLALLLCSGKAFTASPLQFNISLATFSNELSQPSITAIYKDRTGFLWIGTQSGLNKYDGSNTTTFNSNRTPPHRLPASYISQISQSLDGTLWIATYGGGLARYDERTGSFDPITGSSSRKYNLLRSLFIQSNGMIWVGTKDKGVGVYDPTLDRFDSWLPSNQINVEIGTAFEIIEDGFGQIWAAGKNGLYLIDRETRLITAHPFPNNPSRPLLSATAIEYIGSGIIWVGTTTGDLLQFDTRKAKYIASEKATDLELGWINDLVYKDNALYMATDNGLTIFNIKKFEYHTFTQSNSLLSNDFAISLLADHDSLIVGTANGLNILSASPFYRYQSSNSNIFDDISSFTQRPNHEIWVGTFNGVFRFDEHNEQHKPLEKVFNTANSYGRRVTAMDINLEELWLGYYNGGIQIVDLKTGSTRSPNIPANKDLAITTIVHTDNGYTWIGTYNQGLFRIEGDEVVAYFTAPDSKNSIPEPSIVFVMETQDGLMLIGTETAMYQIDPSTNVILRLEPVITNNTKAPVLLSGAENIEGDIWLSVKDMGLFIWKKNGFPRNSVKLEALPGNKDLPSTTIYAIEFDYKGFAWVSTTRGIAKLTSSGQLVDLYTTADGLQGNDFNQSSSFKDSQGRIYFGGSNGYNRFDPSLERVIPPRPPVVLTKLNIAGEEPKLPVAIHQLESLELSYLDYSINLDFSVLDYSDPNNNHYRYKLENFDPQWIENGTKNSATYTNLPPGDYKFRAQGASSAGVWNREGVSLDIVIHPAPWRSWPAYVLYFFVFCVLVRLGKQYYDNVVLRKKATIIAMEMHHAADKATDDLQEQLDYQDEFVKVVHAHSANTLELIGGFISLQADPLDNSHRVASLRQLDACLLYQGDELLANLEAYTNLVINELLIEKNCDTQSITTINEIPDRLVYGELATPLSIVIYELFRNSFHRASHSPGRAKFIHIRLQELFDGPLEHSREFKLSVEDNIERSIGASSQDSIETSGMALVSSIAKKLNGTVEISSGDGTQVSLSFAATKLWYEA